ncbi:MAG: hypothetical protein RMM08_01515 [Armatimonadota bacterium]|nr:hypothetical protein [Armatimonadota bacterium]
MAVVERGTVRQGQIVLEHPLELEEGTEVIVRIETLSALPQEASVSRDLKSLRFFGIWADRHDMTDSVGWVREERQKWKTRIERQE